MSFLSPKAGFTLAELLIALALLGIIAAFTIPKVLQSSAEQETTAKLRETVATLENAWRVKRDSLGVSLYWTIRNDVNTVAQSELFVSDPGAPLNGVADHECADEAATGAGWMLFQSGVVVSGLNWSGIPAGPCLTDAAHSGSNAVLCIDVNGRAAPNEPGQDIFLGNFNRCAAWTALPTNENAALKSFRWGNGGTAPDSDIRGLGGAVWSPPSHPNFGVGNSSPCTVVGCRLTR